MVRCFYLGLWLATAACVFRTLDRAGVEFSWADDLRMAQVQAQEPGPPLASEASPSASADAGPQVAARMAGPAPADFDPAAGIPFAGTKVLAQVGGEVILVADVASYVNEITQKLADQIPPDQLDAFRTARMQERMVQLVEVKLVMQEIRQLVPEENLTKLLTRVGDDFEANELPRALRRSNVTTRAELDGYLRRLGSSLEREKQAYVERVLTMQWVQQQVRRDREVTRDQMFAWYQEHLAEYSHLASVQWEELSVAFTNYSSKTAAYAALAEMGNQVYAGAAWAEVARARSDGATAQQGGLHEETTQGSLKWQNVDEALFSLPVGEMSPILETDRGFMIVRVIARRDAGRTPFAEVQAEIKEKIQQQRLEVEIDAYLNRLREETPIWTAFDAPAESTEPNGPQTAVRDRLQR